MRSHAVNSAEFVPFKELKVGRIVHFANGQWVSVEAKWMEWLIEAEHRVKSHDAIVAVLRALLEHESGNGAEHDSRFLELAKINARAALKAATEQEPPRESRPMDDDGIAAC